MRSKYGHRWILALALLALGVAGVATEQAVAQETAQDIQAAEVTLSGQLAQSAAGDYVLVEAESGDSIVLRGANDDLAGHIGSSVAVTGAWASDDEGREYFAVTSIASS